MVENFEKKYNSLLNEEEKNFVKEIMDFKQGEKDEKKEKLFNRFKNECLNTINKLISEADSDEKEGLLAIKEQIEEKESLCYYNIIAWGLSKDRLAKINE